MDIEKETELRNAWNFSKDFWQFIKRYYFPPQDPAEEQFWHNLHEDALALAAKYGNHRFCITQINAYVDYLEAKYEQAITRQDHPLAPTGR